MDGDEDWFLGGEGPGVLDVQEIRAQLAFSGSVQALREIRWVYTIKETSQEFLFRDQRAHYVTPNPLLDKFLYLISLVIGYVARERFLVSKLTFRRRIILADVSTIVICNCAKKAE